MMTSKLVVIFSWAEIIALRAEKLLHQSARQHTCDAAAVVTGCEGRLHCHDLIARQRLQPLEHAIVERTAAECLGTGKAHRPRIGSGESHAQVGELIALAPQRHSDKKYLPSPRVSVTGSSCRA